MSKEIVKSPVLELVVKEKTLGALITNAKDLKVLVENSISKYDASNYSEDDIEKAKEDKAILNRFAKELNKKRIELEKEFSAPFEEFKRTVTDTIAIINDASKKIDDVVKIVENREKDEKRKSIDDFFCERGFDKIVPLSKIFDEKWLNKTASIKSIKSSIESKIEDVTTSLAIIEALEEDVDVLKLYYLEKLDINETLKYAKSLKENRERLKAIEATRNEEEPASALVTGEESSISQNKEEVLERTFKVRCAKEKLIALGNFMNNNGILFRKL